ncbi:MAG: hypothetical protein WDN47_02200 [Candidatus Doudnabacteria bacterium]
MPHCPVMARYTRIEANIIGIQARLNNPRVPEFRKQALTRTLAAQRAAANRIAAVLQGAPGQVFLSAQLTRKPDEHPKGYGHGV